MAITLYHELTTTAQNWAINYLKLRDGAQLRWGYWRVENEAPRGYVLLLPGRIEFIEKYTEIAHEWAMRGYQAVCIDWRGQGGSTRLLQDAHKSHIDSFDTHLRDLSEFWSKVWLPQTEGGSTLVHAHSTGAHLAIRFLSRARRTQGADALIVSAPLMGMNYGTPLPGFIAAAIVSLMGRLRATAYALGQGPHIQIERPFEENKLTSDENRYHVWQNLQEEYPELATGGATWGWVKAAQDSCHKLVAGLASLKLPMLALTTPNDQVVDGPIQEKLKAVATVVPFPESMHEIFMERETLRAYAWNVIDDFLLKQHKPAS